MSGKQYQTPLTARWTVDGFVIGLPYGPNTDWLKNVLANGSATVVYDGGSYLCDEPKVISCAEAAGDFSARERQTLRLMGVDECLRLHRVMPPRRPERSQPPQGRTASGDQLMTNRGVKT
jgi:hypothetical protein